ncbi:glutamine amidotransferase [Enterobacteriaceae bacterium H11S18]|uniref:glutamine amidotransferase n=1 Tax=Dryocola clanedunensis TaxID=2925396 RepID=UPI0022F08BF8|nr:glutamine amidotransferase [Dryocola clanedunensis]MCT4705639.1 glutamine amidotransferase [Dryocola clanedunensis]MCT4711751.1 glutamine amidotransferase [Dryocola clanedunensis]
MPESLPILLVQMGHPPADIRAAVGEQPQWFRAALGDKVPVKVVCPFDGDPLPVAGTFRAAVISGSWSMVTEHEAWSERTAEWTREMMQAGVPILGVCYGHQLMAYAMGGVVDYHPQGSEVGQLPVMLSAAAKQDALLRALPDTFDVFLSHEQSVLTLPPGATALGASGHDPHQIIRYSPTALSVQFHPEFTAPVMNKIITSRSERIAMKGKDRDALLSRVSDTPESRSLLQRFVFGG